MPRPGFDNEDQVLEYMKKIAVGRSGFSSFLQLESVRCWEGEAEIVMQIRPEMTQHHGFAHGAIVGLMADNACAWAASSAVGDVVTGSYSINFLAPAKGDQLRSKGSVVKAGKRQVVVRADVWSEAEGEEPVLVAVAQGTIVPTGIVTSKETAKTA
uniref:PaaI family thioesterase n=1 Tax=uncultured Altererythrobacter sp. TaxID=500840 RepID=UPI0026313B39|nr:PaaI family thioesterase [uncultured Altererythrobacter sp.]